jgi:hypothetical protein
LVVPRQSDLLETLAGLPEDTLGQRPRQAPSGLWKGGLVIGRYVPAATPPKYIRTNYDIRAKSVINRRRHERAASSNRC